MMSMFTDWIELADEAERKGAVVHGVGMHLGSSWFTPEEFRNLARSGRSNFDIVNFRLVSARDKMSTLRGEASKALAKAESIAHLAGEKRREERREVSYRGFEITYQRKPGPGHDWDFIHPNFADGPDTPGWACGSAATVADAMAMIDEQLDDAIAEGRVW